MRPRRSRRIYHHTKKKIKRATATAVALEFQAKRYKIMRGLNQRQARKPEPRFPCPPAKNMWALWACRRKFGISFVVPDRVAVEISDKRRVRGSRPLRILRIPAGGPVVFNSIIKEAERAAQPFRHSSNGSKPDPKKAYHRSRMNDWYPQLVFYCA